MIDGTDFRATEIAARFIASGYRLRQNPTYTRNSPAAFDSLPLSYHPECCFQGSKGSHISAKMGAFGAWHYFHELYMSPPPDNPPRHKAEQGFMIHGRRASNGIKYDYVNRFSNTFEIEGW